MIIVWRWWYFLGLDVEQPFVRLGAHVALYGFTTSWVSEGKDRSTGRSTPSCPRGTRSCARWPQPPAATVAMTMSCRSSRVFTRSY